MALLGDFIVALDIAAGNHGLVTCPQLLAAGLSSSSIARLASTPGALAPLGGGLYLIPVLEDLRFGHMRVALQRVDPTRLLNQIAADPLGPRSGVLSHHAAAELHGALDLPLEIHVTVPRRRRLSRLIAHTVELRPEEIVFIAGMPVTSAERTT